MSERKFFCFGKNDFCDYAYNAGACGKCKHMDGSGGEKRSVPEPPRLDRSAWEPCEECKEISYWDEKCDNCRYDDLFANQEPCASCESKSKWEPCYSFCPRCGRPLTDAAWDMLEKRLEGRK